MPTLSAVAMFFQDNGTIASDVHSIMIAQWIMAAFCVLLILALLGAAIAVMMIVGKVKKQVNDLTKTVEAKAMPLIAQGQDIAAKVNDVIGDLKPKIARVTSDLEPKIASVTSDVQHISALVRSKVDEAGTTFTQVNSTVQDVNTKSKAQVQRVNGMVSEALTTTEHVSRSIQHGIKVPIVKITEWVAAAKAGIEGLADRIPFLHHVAPPMRSGSAGTTRTGSRPMSAPGPVPVRPATTGGSGSSGSGYGSGTPGSGSTGSGYGSATSGSGTGSAGSGPGSGYGSGTPGAAGTTSRGAATTSGTGQSGTAAPGGPPFVPAPDKTKS